MNKKIINKKVVWLSIAFVAIILFIGISVVVAQSGSVNEVLYQWGILDKSDKRSSTLILKGDHIQVSKEEMDVITQKKYCRVWVRQRLKQIQNVFY